MSAIAQYKPDYTKYFRYRSQEPYFLRPEERLAIKNVANLLPVDALVQTGVPKALALAYLGTAAYSAYMEAEQTKAEKERLTREAQNRQLLQLTQTQSTLDEIKAIQQRQTMALEGQAKSHGEEVEIEEEPIDRMSSGKSDMKTYIEYTIAKDSFHPSIIHTDNPKRPILIDLDLPLKRRYVYQNMAIRNESIDTAVKEMLNDIKRRGYEVVMNDPKYRDRGIHEYFDPISLARKIINPAVYLPKILSEIFLPVHKKMLTDMVMMEIPDEFNAGDDEFGENDENVGTMYSNDFIKAAEKSGFIDPGLDREDIGYGKYMQVTEKLGSSFPKDEAAI